MLKTMPFFLASALIVSASTNVLAMAAPSSSSPDVSFSVFFDPGAATLSKEGREIASVVAAKFVTIHRSHAAALVIVNSETDDQDNASLAKKRIEAVRAQLIRDGVPEKSVTADESASIHAKPVHLLEALDRRVSISIQENMVMGQAAE